MKSKLMLAVVVMMLFSNQTSAQEKREEYKCYVMTNQGERLFRFSWFPSRTKHYIAQLPDTKMPDLGFNQGLPLYAKKVLECVKFSESFTSSPARNLDEEMAEQG